MWRLRELFDRLRWYLTLPAEWARRIAHDFRERLEYLRDEGFSLGIVRLFLHYLGIPFYATIAVLRYVWLMLVYFWQHGNFRLILEGLPALIVGGTVLGLTIVWFLTPNVRWVGRYRNAIEESVKNEQYEDSRLYYERWQQLEGEQDEIRYGLAFVADKLGNHERAFAIMSSLAPRDEQGYGRAHLWMARRLTQSNTNNPQLLRMALAHLLRSLNENPNETQAHTLLVQVYLALGEPDKAGPHLEEAAKYRQDFRLALANYYASVRGDVEKARTIAEGVRDHFRTQALRDPDDHRARKNWVQALLALEQYEEAVKVLQDGLILTPGPEYRTALANVYITWADAMQRDPKHDPAEPLMLLERALKFDPKNMVLLGRLIETGRTKGPAAEHAKEMMHKLLAKGQAASLVHLLLGTDALMDGEWDKAHHHLLQSYRLDPTTPIVANNLAWLLAHMQPPDLPQARELANSIVERYPNEPSYRDTRGLILLKMGNYKDALSDLEIALQARPNDAGVHRHLAECYRALGIDEMADQHEKLAQPPAEGE